LGKYDKFGDHIGQSNSDKIKLTFTEVEEILGFPLPESSRIHRPWWANDKYHSQAVDGWIKHGWRVSYVSMKDQIVVFEKLGKGTISKRNIVQKQVLPITSAQFESLARVALSELYKTALFPGKISGVPKLFDMVSEDRTIVGDAKYLTMVRGQYLPPAKFSVIAEHVWLLEKTGAKEKFLVFGNDRRVPEEWLKRYKELAIDIKFFFFDTKKETVLRLN